MIKKALIWLVAAFVVYYLVTRPDDSASVVRDAADALRTAFDSLLTFFRGLTS